MFYFRDNRFHNSCSMNVFFGWKICQCYRFLLFSSLQMSRCLTYWLAHIFISRYIYSCHSHSEHLQFSFLFFVQWFSLYSIYRSKNFFRERFSFINSSAKKSNDNKLQIEWHYFGLFKVLLKLSTNSKHSARLSVSFRVRKSTVPNSVLDISVNLAFLAALKALHLHS